MPIYTKKGDKGQTGLPGERRLPKTDLIFEVLGGIDQTNALVGLAVSQISQEGESDQKLARQLEEIQSSFLGVGASIAAEMPDQKFLASLPKLTDQLEDQIDEWNKLLPALRNFILPGGAPAGASLHLARVSVRQAERAFHRLDTSHKTAEIAQYLNRLSDFFFQAARFVNFSQHQKESVWKPNRQI